MREEEKQVPERPSTRILRENRHLIEEIESINEYKELNLLCTDICNAASANTDQWHLSPKEKEAHDFLAYFRLIGSDYVYQKFDKVIENLERMEEFDKSDPLGINDKVKALAAKIIELAKGKAQAEISR